MVVYRKEILNLNEDEMRAIDSGVKDMQNNFDKLFNVRFANMSRHNTQNFYDSFTGIIQQLALQIRSAEYDVIALREKFNDAIQLCKDSGAPVDSPWRKVIDVDQELIKSMHKSLEYRTLALEFFVQVSDRLVKLIEETKDIELEKIKADTNASSFEKLIKSLQEQYEHVIKQYQGENEMLRKELRESLDILRKQQQFSERRTHFKMKGQNTDSMEDDFFEEEKQEVDKQVEDLKQLTGDKSREVPVIEKEDVDSAQTTTIIEEAKLKQTKKDKIIFLCNKFMALDKSKEETYEIIKIDFPYITMADISYGYRMIQDLRKSGG